ncbi:MAG: ABC transporter permease [Clostridiales bacterium]|nr:ABC transporter permease [Clostridiales bacterium]
MKIRNINFLASANLKGNRKSGTVIALTVILVISLTVISSFSLTITGAVNEYKQDTRARMLEVDPWNGALTEDVIESIEQIEHVESVNELKGMWDHGFYITGVSDENGEVNEELQQEYNDKDAFISAWSLIGDEKMNVIAGDTLDDSPTFSCIIPSLFYPFDLEYTGEGYDNNLDYIDGESLLGKTITVCAGEYFEDLYNIDPEDSINGNEWVYLPALEYKLKIVGVYYSSPTAKGYYDDIYVSEETGVLIEEMAVEAYLDDLTSDDSLVAKWWNTPSLHTHYVVVDDVDNIEAVYNELTEMNIVCAGDSELGIRESVVTMSYIFSIASVLMIAVTMILLVINLMQSSVNSLIERKGEIGLLKAVGYRNSQIFACLYCEQLKMTVYGFVIGAASSGAIIFICNLIFNHLDYIARLYIVDWSYYFIFLAISLAAAITVPLICQLITLHKLNKIQPKDAMS